MVESWGRRPRRTTRHPAVRRLQGGSRRTTRAALPTLSFDRFLSYSPSWQETGTFLAVVAYGVLVYSFSFRYLRLFPEERELKAEVQQEEEELRVMAGRY